MPRAYATALCAWVLATLGAGTTATAAVPREPDRAPVTVRIAGPAQPRAGQTVALVITVKRAPTALIPMDLVIELPLGAKLVSGVLKERLVDTKRTSLIRRVKVRLEQVPVQDVKVAVDVRTEAWGVHATDAYRFGRAEPALAATPGAGPEVRVRGKNFGRGIPIGGKAPAH